ncbi:MAG: metallophosphoesterase [Ferruginibacter sp.]
MQRKMVFIAVSLSVFFLSCKKEIEDDSAAQTQNSALILEKKGNPHLKIAIVSDIHYMHPSLLINGGADGIAFQNYIAQDPKLVQYSDPIWRQVVSELKNEKPDILLVTGDITKDGEKIGHEAMAGFLTQLEKCGTKVLVIPGNHDINNAKAKLYDGNNDYPVAQTTPAAFANIYANFGYNAALSRDACSLSYVAQLKPGLRLIAIDASKYEEYGPSGDVAAGRIKPATLAWILEQIAIAKQHNIQVFAMMHHNLVEHYAGQATLDPGYVVDDWQNVAKSLMDAGLKIIFTGHYHANDISSYTQNGKEITDIETGSLVTAPIPYRIITLKKDMLEVKSTTVKSIRARLPGGLSFPVYSSRFLSRHLDGYFYYYLGSLLGVDPAIVPTAVPLFRNGIMAHFAGDEKMPTDQRRKIEALSILPPGSSAGPTPDVLAGIVTTLWTDLGIKDNTTYVKY